jgi:hypothetical protein
MSALTRLHAGGTLQQHSRPCSFLRLCLPGSQILFHVYNMLYKYMKLFTDLLPCFACCCSGMQVAGARVFHSAGAFKSVVQLRPDGSTVPINPNAKYTIVATDYMLQGGDGFSMFKGAEVLLPAGLPYAEQVIEDLKLFPQGVSGDLPGL